MKATLMIGAAACLIFLGCAHSTSNAGQTADSSNITKIRNDSVHEAGTDRPGGSNRPGQDTSIKSTPDNRNMGKGNGNTGNDK